MIRQQAFNQTGNKMLKGGLHCHTTRSDGRGEPEEVIRLHAEHGYDFLALTDHKIYNFKNFAPETGVIIVPGMEMDRRLEGDAHRTFHTVCIGPMEDNGFEQDQRVEPGRVKDQFEYQKDLDWIHGNNNLTFYCHPEWSCTPARDFEQMQGDFALEICNTCGAYLNEQDCDAAYWDELLRQGKRLYGVATDDGHGMSEHCKGWVRVNAEKDLNSILAALKNGAFYSSCGPEIYDFYVEDGKAHVKCSPVKRIRFHYGFVPTYICRAAEGETIESGERALNEHYTYIRASIVDADGKIAWTNPIFLK